MALVITQTKTALGPNLTASFAVAGGVAPYSWTVLPSGAGGSINSSTAIYTAPPAVSNVTTGFYDTIQVTDSSVTPLVATSQIMVGNYWMLILEIIQKIMNLSPEQIWMFDQKTFQPDDNSLSPWVILMLPSQKTFASGLHPAGTPVGQGGAGWNQTEKWANFSGPMDIHLISRDLSALNRKEELVMCLDGPYSRAQQVANSFYIARIPHSIVDVSGIDGADITYHYVISVEVQHGSSRMFPTEYFDTFQTTQIDTSN